MLKDLIEKKSKAEELTLANYYEIIDYVLKNGQDQLTSKMFITLNSFGMSKKEVLYLTMAMRDSGRVIKYNQTIFEKHSTGGIGDPSSIVLIPLLASVGYKVIKTTARSFVFTNGTADRFKAIPNFTASLTDDQIKNQLDKVGACVLTHNGDMVPADKILYDVREDLDLEDDLSLLASSIASKKLASGANVVLVDVKFGQASVVKTERQAKELASLLKYIFKHSNVKAVIVITNTDQIIGEGVGNALELTDAIQVLQGKKCLLRDVVMTYATEMIKASKKKYSRKEVHDVLATALDNGSAYNKFLEMVKSQKGDVTVIKDAKIFKPKQSINFVAERAGYVGYINSLMLGEITRRLCKDSHDDNIGAVMRVKIGDYIEKGDAIVSYYFNDKREFNKYKTAIAGCVRVTDEKIKPVKVIEKVIR